MCEQLRLNRREMPIALAGISATLHPSLATFLLSTDSLLPIRSIHTSLQRSPCASLATLQAHLCHQPDPCGGPLRLMCCRQVSCRCQLDQPCSGSHLVAETADSSTVQKVLRHCSNMDPCRHWYLLHTDVAVQTSVGGCQVLLELASHQHWLMKRGIARSYVDSPGWLGCLSICADPCCLDFGPSEQVMAE